MNGCFFSDGINRVQNDITLTGLVSSGVKKRRKYFRSVYLDVASSVAIVNTPEQHVRKLTDLTKYELRKAVMSQTIL